MKTKVLLFNLVLFSIIFLSCQTDIVNQPDKITLKSYVGSVTVSSKTNNKVSFIAKASWHNGCGKFSHFTSTKTDNVFDITVYGEQPKDAVCTLAIIEYDAPIEISIEESGKYTFRFWRSDATTLDTTITF